MPIGVMNRAGLKLIGLSAGATPPVTPGGFSPVTLTNAEAVPFVYGEYAYVFGNDSVKKAFANGTLAQASAIWQCVEPLGIVAGGTGRFVSGGRVAGLAGRTANAIFYLSTVPGAFSATPDITIGEFNVILGTGISATETIFNPQLPIQN